MGLKNLANITSIYFSQITHPILSTIVPKNMLSNRTIKLIGFRFRLLKFCGATYFEWDKDNNNIKHVSPIIFFHMLLGTVSSHFFPPILMLHMYMKLHPFDEDEQDPDLFASMVIAWGELLLSTTICFLNNVVSQKRQEIIFVFNELLTYNTRIQGSQ